MKKVCALLSMIILSLSLVACAGDANQAGDNPGENSEDQNFMSSLSEFTYTYTVDESWLKDKITETSFVYFPNGDRFEANAPKMTIEESYAYKSADSYDDQISYLESTLDTIQNITIDDRNEKRIGNNAGILVSFSDDLGNKGKMLVFFATPETVGKVQYMAAEESFDSYSKNFDEIVDSISAS